MKVLNTQRLEHYRTAASVAQRVASGAVHVTPDDLAALVDRYTEGLVDEVKIAIAAQCSCHAAGCLHDLIRAAAGDPVHAKAELLNKLHAEERRCARMIDAGEVLRKASTDAEAENDRLRAALLKAQAAVRRYAARVNEFALAVPDCDEGMRPAEAIGAAQADLYIALDMHEDIARGSEVTSS